MTYFSQLCLRMNKVSVISWALFVSLSFIWGSSFILMKEGLKFFTAYEVAAIRMLSAGIVLLPFTGKAWRQINRKEFQIIFLTGILGSFLPAILFCVAETKIDSALAGMLNALTPLFVLTIGVLFFGAKTTGKKILGVITGFAGMVLLFLSQQKDLPAGEFLYVLLVLIATVCYGLNVNMVSKHLKHLGSIQIAALAFGSLVPLSLMVLLAEKTFSKDLMNPVALKAASSAIGLGIVGTAVATILFYQLMKRAGALFSSMVTYGVPFVAVFWGVLAGELITILQMAGLLIILTGVYLANRQ
jgi:drug/metabolite transporter (DMT)-like permease